MNTLEKASMTQSRNGKKKKSEHKGSELNEVKESKKFKTLEKESNIETGNGKKIKKKEKESESEEVHKKLVEYEDNINTQILEKECMIKLNSDKQPKKKNKRKENVSEDTDKEVTNSEECKGNNECKRISNLEDDTLIEPEDNDKIRKKIDKQDLRLTEKKVCKSGVIFDTSDNERNNKNWEKNSKNNKESTIDDELKSSSKQRIDREVVDKKRKKERKKKLDDNVSHSDKKIGSRVKNMKKNKLPHLDEEQERSSSKKKRKMNSVIESVESSSQREKKRKICDGSEGEHINKNKSNKENNDIAEKDAFMGKNEKLNDEPLHPIPRRVRFSSKQSIDREVVDKKRKKEGKKKLDDNVSHSDKKIESPVKNMKKNKLPHLDEEQERSSSKKKRKMNSVIDIECVESSSRREKKRKICDGSEGERINKNKSNKENNDIAEKDAFMGKNKKLNDEPLHPIPRRVRFSSNVQVFPVNEDGSTEKAYPEKNGDDSCNTIYNEKNNFAGKRFSPYEDQLIRDATQKYITVNQLGEDSIENIVYSGKSGSGLKGCWKEISKDLPWRDFRSVYFRGRLILQMSMLAENRGFSEEEIKKVMDFHAKNGPKWNELGKKLKKTMVHVKDAYRRRRLQQTVKKGKWSQDEYQKLYDLVHQNICAKIHEKKKNKHPMSRDDISWEALSENLKTRTMSSCCTKWYVSLASPLVREEKWSDCDDYRLLDALYYQEACCEEDVDWDNLVETRPGEYCEIRWKEMVRNIGEYKQRSFRDQINMLKGRYNINMLKYVEALKNKNREEACDDEEENGDEQDADKSEEEENEDEHDADKDKEEE